MCPRPFPTRSRPTRVIAYETGRLGRRAGRCLDRRRPRPHRPCPPPRARDRGVHAAPGHRGLRPRRGHLARPRRTPTAWQQLEHAADLADDLYPAYRWFLFDGRERYSVPYTVFGPKRAAIYVGDMYFVFTSTEHIRELTRHFDNLIRAARIQPNETAACIRELIEGRLMIASLPMYDWPEVREATDAWRQAVARASGGGSRASFDSSHGRSCGVVAQIRSGLQPDLRLSIHARVPRQAQLVATPHYVVRRLRGPELPQHRLRRARRRSARRLRGRARGLQHARFDVGHAGAEARLRALRRGRRLLRTAIETGGHVNSLDRGARRRGRCLRHRCVCVASPGAIARSFSKVWSRSPARPPFRRFPT